MNVKWFIENFTLGNGFDDLIQEISNQKYEHHVISYFPRKNVDYNNVFADDDCVIFYGSIQLGIELQTNKPKWIPGVIANWNSFECEIYYPFVSKLLLNNDYAFYSVEEASKNHWDLFRKHGVEGSVFIRPSSGKKPFTAKVLNIQEFEKFFDSWVIPYTNPSDKLAVCSPKIINGEWRFICTPDEILGKSSYLYQGATLQVPSAPTKAIAVCMDVLHEMKIAGWKPDPFFSVDVVEDVNGNCRLMELNSFSTCGLYACHKPTIVREVSKYAEWMFNVGK